MTVFIVDSAAARFIIIGTCTPFDALADLSFCVALVEAFGFGADMRADGDVRRAFALFGIGVARESGLTFLDIIEIPCAVILACHDAAAVVSACDIFWRAFDRFAFSAFVVAAIGAEIERLDGFGAFGGTMIHGRRFSVSAKAEIGVRRTFGRIGGLNTFVFFGVANRRIIWTRTGIAPFSIVVARLITILAGAFRCGRRTLFRDTIFCLVAANWLVAWAIRVGLPESVIPAGAIPAGTRTLERVRFTLAATLDASDRTGVTNRRFVRAWHRGFPFVVVAACFSAFEIVSAFDFGCNALKIVGYAVKSSGITCRFVVGA